MNISVADPCLIYEPKNDKLKHFKRRGNPLLSLHIFCYFAVRIIESYQKISYEREHVCHFTPSCSEYSRLAYCKYGFVYASYLTVLRLKECGNPFTEWPKLNFP